MSQSIKLFLLVTSLLFAGCASNVPESIRTSQAVVISVNQAKSDPQSYSGQNVRWGGDIASVKPMQNETLVEVVGRELGSQGRPKDNDVSSGRFMASIPGFIDPVIYKEGRQMTVVGNLSGSMKQSIGEHQYDYPIVAVELYHLWEPLPQISPYDRYPWYYDPWYDPWGYPFHWHHRPYYWW